MQPRDTSMSSLGPSVCFSFTVMVDSPSASKMGTPSSSTSSAPSSHEPPKLKANGLRLDGETGEDKRTRLYESVTRVLT